MSPVGSCSARGGCPFPNRKGQLRVLFFEDKPDEAPDRLILTHGFLKKTDETPTNEIRRYRRLRRRYFNWKFEADDDG